MSSLLAYPGQGSQYAGMLANLPQAPEIRDTLQEASDVLQMPVSRLDSDAALRSTRNVQLSLLIAGVACTRLLETRAPASDYVAGLSIGAYAAAVTAEALTFADALRLVSLRGELMQNAYPEGYGMTAVIGLEQPQVEQLIGRIDRAAPLYIANLNADNQIVVAGANTALDALEGAVRQHGNGVSRRVAITVPSHCPLLDEPARALADAFQRVPLNTPRRRYLSGTFARPIQTPDALRDDLAFNMARPVRWHATLLAARERGVRLHIELPPGNVLTGLARRVFEPSSVIAFQGSRLDTLHALLREEVNRRA